MEEQKGCFLYMESRERPSTWRRGASRDSSVAPILVQFHFLRRSSSFLVLVKYMMRSLEADEKKSFTLHVDRWFDHDSFVPEYLICTIGEV